MLAFRWLGLAKTKMTRAPHPVLARLLLVPRPKIIATINFKGGVGKTTLTWCLGKIAAGNLEAVGRSLLLFDLDAQMSLTQAISLEEDGALGGRFSRWFFERKAPDLFDAILNYARNGSSEQFDSSMVYPITNNYHFVPSTEKLYRLELEFFKNNRISNKLKEFLGAFLDQLNAQPGLPNYDYALFDCPPSLTALSLSVLAVADLIFIPVNPDFYSSKGVGLLIETLYMALSPQPLPKIAIVMNKAKLYRKEPTKETKGYWHDIKRISEQVRREFDIKVLCLDEMIEEKADIKRAVSNGEIPPEIIEKLENIWYNLEGFLHGTIS
jgi:chromosome partitioning protein